MIAMPPNERACATTGPTVLVVDDEELNRELYRSVLQRAGYTVLVACDGDEALELVALRQPDVVLLDFRMPKVDGPTFLRALRGRLQIADLPVIVLTSSNDSENIAEAFDAGADDYLVKPVDARILQARLRSTLNSRDFSRKMRDATDREQRQEALKDELLADLLEAREVQRAQLPTLPCRYSGVWVSGAVEPCGHVGGDVIDVMQLPDGSVVAVAMDVAGHGTGAALVASAIRSQLRGLLSSRGIDESIVMLGRWLLGEAASRHVCVGVIKLQGRSFSILNAGLPPIWVGKADAPRVLVHSSGPPPGLFESKSYEVVTGTLGQDEVVAMVSDGVTEPFGFMDDVQSVMPRLLSFAADAPLASDVSSRLRALFADTPQPDDATALVIGATA